jgi:hypothetical protein
MFGDRRIDDAARSEFLQQALRNLVGALVFGDFLTHDKDVVIGAHFFRHRVAKRLAHGLSDHFGSGRNCRIGGNFRLRLRRDGRRRRRRFGWGGLWRFRFRRLGLGRSNVTGTLAVLQQNGDRCVDLDALRTGGNQQLTDRAFVDRLDLHRRLIGLNLGDHVAGGHLVPLVLQPFRERAFLHGRGKRGHKDFYWHIGPSPDQSRMSV